MKRVLLVDATTRDLIVASCDALSFGGYGYRFGGSSTSNAVRLALARARELGRGPNGASLTGEIPVKADTRGLYEDYTRPRVAAVVRDILADFASGGVPVAESAPWGERMWLSVPETLLAPIALRAMANRRTALRELALVVDAAMLHEVQALVAHEKAEAIQSWARARADETREVGFSGNRKLHETLREVASRNGYDADTLLWRRVRDEIAVR